MKIVLSLIFTLMWMIPAIIILVIIGAIAFAINPIVGILYVLWILFVSAVAVIWTVGKILYNKNKK